MQRLQFEITGAGGDTGQAVHGKVHQLRWNPTTPDTGAGLEIGILPRDADSGDGWVVYSRTTGMDADFVAMPRHPPTYSTATGASGDSGYERYALAGDRVRVKVSNTTTLAGRLYAWIDQ